ncbi:hypothetical protein [Kineococcus sp. SYSU DK005]|uniref:hypothetical protein n=1 Tax=Kineococcus sp. SYSU DK005 TaxID=3383126 RepID=UPI003D7ED3F3
MHGRDGGPAEPPPATAGPLPGPLPTALAAVLDRAGDAWDAAEADRELQELPLLALRRRRELLLGELRRAGHWARLVRARRDLLVAATVGADALEVPVEAGAHGGPLEAHLAAHVPVPAPGAALPAVADPNDVLRGLVLTAGPGASAGDVEQLRALGTAARRLGAYADALEAELELVTEVLLQRYREVVAPAVQPVG